MPVNEVQWERVKADRVKVLGDSGDRLGILWHKRDLQDGALLPWYLERGYVGSASSCMLTQMIWVGKEMQSASYAKW